MPNADIDPSPQTPYGAAPALIATDLDGTLLRDDGTPSARSVDAVEAVEAAGVAFVVATARPPRWMHDLLPVVGAHGVAICSNGAFVYDVADGKVLVERTISKNVVLDIVADLRAAIPTVTFALESAVGFGREAAYRSRHPEPDDIPIGAVETLLDPLPGKLLARADSVAGEEFVQTVERLIGDRAVVSISDVSGLVEISAGGVTKAAVLAEWCERIDVEAADVWAFGDMPNDLPMLAWAGTAFAVANAHPSVLEAADMVCGSNQDDGVAAVLESVATALARQAG